MRKKKEDQLEMSSVDTGGTDRYAVSPKVSAVESALDSSILSSGDDDVDSSFASMETSFETDDSDGILMEVDDSLDEDELEELAFMTNPIMGGWVDSAFGWLDKPICVFPFGKQNSLLRQSKGRRKTTLQQMRMGDSTSTVANIKFSASERRNIRQQRKSLSTVNEIDDILSTEGSQYIQTQRIQPLKQDGKDPWEQKPKKELKEEKDTESQKTSAAAEEEEEDGREKVDMTSTVKSADKFSKPFKKSVVSDRREDEKPTKENKSQLNEKSTSERSERTVANESQLFHESRIPEDFEDQMDQSNDEERLEDTLEDLMMDSTDASQSPESSKSQKPVQPTTVTAQEKVKETDSEKVLIDSLKVAEQDKDEGAKNLSIKSKQSAVEPIRQNRIMRAVHRARGALRTKEITDLTHIDAATSANDTPVQPPQIENPPKAIEIIDVLSMDDNDSWTPGASAVDPEPSKETQQFQYRSLTQRNSFSREKTARDPSPSVSRRNLRAYARDPSPSQRAQSSVDTSMNADSLWNEEEAKLKNKGSRAMKQKAKSRVVSNAQTADDLWSEEEQKLQDDTSKSIFNDPKAREAFLGHRRGRLQDTSVNATSRSPSRSRRRQLMKAYTRDEDEKADHSRRSTRSSSIDARRPPTPEITRHINTSRSKSSEEHVDDSGPHDEMSVQLSSHSQVDKLKDLVAVRTIEDGQRLRLHRGTIDQEPIDVHKYMERSVSRGRRDNHEKQHQFSRRRSKSREIVDLAHVDNMETQHPRSCSRDSRDDNDSRQGSRAKQRTSKPSKAVADWPDYETVVSATKELRKLEKKIEKQLRQAKRDPQANDEWEAQTVSSKEIKKLEKQLAQKLQRDNEKRATKLKRIKRKVPKPPTPSEAVSKKSMVDNSDSKQAGEVNKTTVPAVETHGSADVNAAAHDHCERSQLRSLRSSRYFRNSSRRGGLSLIGRTENKD